MSLVYLDVVAVLAVLMRSRATANVRFNLPLRLTSGIFASPPNFHEIWIKVTELTIDLSTGVGLN